jgi:hypothetical protein
VDPDRAARLDARAARGGRRREHRAPVGTSRTRRLAAGALVAALAVAVFAVSRRGSASSASAPVTAPLATDTTVPVDPEPLRSLFAGEPACTDHGADVPEVSCTVGGVRVDARLVGVGTAARAFGPAAPPRRGPPACAVGRADERTWSRPAAPTVVAGRYRCDIEAGRAAMWWTDDSGIIVHAVASDADLAHLFEWWQTNLARR